MSVTCPECGDSRPHVWLYPRLHTDTRACARCIGMAEPDGPVEWTGSDEDGWHRLRQTPWEGRGIVPLYEWRPPSDWHYPSVACEERIDSESIVRVVAMPEMSKYGHCYECVYVNEKSGVMRKLGTCRSATQAKQGMPAIVREVKWRKQQRLKRLAEQAQATKRQS